MDNTFQQEFEYIYSIVQNEEYFHFVKCMDEISRLKGWNDMTTLYQQVVMHTILHHHYDGRSITSFTDRERIVTLPSEIMELELNLTQVQMFAIMNDMFTMIFHSGNMITIQFKQPPYSVDLGLFHFQIKEGIYLISLLYYFRGYLLDEGVQTKLDPHLIFNTYIRFLKCLGMGQQSYKIECGTLIVPHLPSLRSEPLTLLNLEHLVDEFVGTYSIFENTGHQYFINLIRRHDNVRQVRIHPVKISESLRFYPSPFDRYQIQFILTCPLISYIECNKLRRQMITRISDMEVGNERNEMIRLTSLPLEIFYKILNKSENLFEHTECGCHALHCAKRTHTSRCKRMKSMLKSSTNLVFPIEYHQMITRARTRFHCWYFVMITQAKVQAPETLDGIWNAFSIDSFTPEDKAYLLMNGCHLQLSADRLNIDHRILKVNGAENDLEDFLININSTRNHMSPRLNEVDSLTSKTLVRCSQVNEFVPRLKGQRDHFAVFS